MNNRIRYTQDAVLRNVFYQLPKFLFEGEFERMSNDARVLYSLLRDRHDLSEENGWVNEKGEAYLVLSRVELCEMLKLSRPTVSKIMSSLKKHKLIEEERIGQGEVNHIYLLTKNTSSSYTDAP
jgi:DNA-binding transcriptional ArsR family regulator